MFGHIPVALSLLGFLQVLKDAYRVSNVSFWTGNTVSNLIMILPPLCGAVQTYQDGLEFRYVCSFLGLAGA